MTNLLTSGLFRNLMCGLKIPLFFLVKMTPLGEILDTCHYTKSDRKVMLNNGMYNIKFLNRPEVTLIATSFVRSVHTINTKKFKALMEKKLKVPIRKMFKFLTYKNTDIGAFEIIFRRIIKREKAQIVPVSFKRKPLSLQFGEDYKRKLNKEIKKQQ